MLLGVWSMCSSFYITRAMIGTKKTNDSLEKKKAWIWRQNNFLFRVFAVFALKMDKFLVKPKKKPCSITPQERAKQYPGKFHADDNLLFCSIMLSWIILCASISFYFRSRLSLKTKIHDMLFWRLLQSIPLLLQYLGKNM